MESIFPRKTYQMPFFFEKNLNLRESTSILLGWTVFTSLFLLYPGTSYPAILGLRHGTLSNPLNIFTSSWWTSWAIRNMRDRGVTGYIKSDVRYFDPSDICIPQGSYILRIIGTLYPKDAPVLHFNMFRSPLKNPAQQGTLTETEKRLIARRTEFGQNGRGYVEIQSTKVLYYLPSPTDWKRNFNYTKTLAIHYRNRY